jgi:hypothetical protein
MSAKKDIFTTALLSGLSISAAAKEAGISATWAHRLLNNGLREKIDQYRRELFTANLNKLENALSKAIDTLETLMGEDTPPPQRLGAAKTLIEQTIKLFELRDIESRLKKLEEAQTATQG